MSYVNLPRSKKPPLGEFVDEFRSCHGNFGLLRFNLVFRELMMCNSNGDSTIASTTPQQLSIYDLLRNVKSSSRVTFSAGGYSLI